ncbi:MAG: DUF479 domain-containing protein [Chitinophagaceae bacterium]|nr:DUF479 domain-containing protein [Chitinophagaceae bacterium]
MNYLAHARLSFRHPQILLGNMISDFVKGKKKLLYPLPIQAGIMLHRSIDTFTDEHPATRQASEIFRPAYRLYSGAFVDVVYDHFLALDKTAFTPDGLRPFSREVYQQLEQQQQWFPEPFARMFPYMKEQNWLYHYQSHQGIYNSFGGLVRRAAYMDSSEAARELFEKHYQLLESCYRQFWKDVLPFAHEEYERLLQDL